MLNMIVIADNDAFLDYIDRVQPAYFYIVMKHIRTIHVIV